MTAEEWLSTLYARGVIVKLRRNRIDVLPYDEYSKLSDEELLFLRHNRAAIKAAVLAGGRASAAAPGCEDQPRATISKQPDQPPAEKQNRSPTISEARGIGASPDAPITAAPVYCGYCQRTPCLGGDHHAHAYFHRNDPAEVDHRRIASQKEMLRGLAYLPDWYWR